MGEELFEEIPNNVWWTAGANLTKWFFWPAISAVLSFLALLKTIEIASRSERDRRAAEIRLMKAMLFFTATAAGCIRDNRKHVAAAVDHQEMAKIAADKTMLTQLAWGMEQLKVQDMPATQGIDVYVSAWHSMKFYAEELRQVSSRPLSEVLSYLDISKQDMDGYSESFAKIIVRLGGKVGVHEDVFVKHWVTRTRKARGLTARARALWKRPAST